MGIARTTTTMTITNRHSAFVDLPTAVFAGLGMQIEKTALARPSGT